MSAAGRTLLIMAGGTGGHIMPGLAIAEQLQARGWTVRWLGTAHGMENRLVPAAGIALDTIAFSGLRGKGLLHALRGAFQLLGGFISGLRLVGRVRPDVALGMGGYVTVPGGIAAALRGVPLAIVNADARLLLSNRVLLPFTRRILFGLPGPSVRLGDKAMWTGNPVRSAIRGLAAPAARYAAKSGPLSLLVVGGSLGASVLNRTLPLALARLPVERRPHVVHQCGAGHEDTVAALYRDLGVAAEVVPFITDMAARYAAADVVLCRAGAITVSELTVAGVASILVPLTVSTTSHQRDNAVYMEQAGAALHLPQAQLTPEHVAGMLADLTRERLAAMAVAAHGLGKPDATATVADVVEQLAARTKGKADRSGRVEGRP